MISQSLMQDVKADKIKLNIEYMKMQAYLTSQRSHLCGQISMDEHQRSVRICGWVGAYRDHGGIIFMDCRDFSGQVQLVFEPENVGVFQKAERLRDEWVVSVMGQVRQRPDGTINSALKTGSVEIVVSELTILSESQALPFSVTDEIDAGESVWQDSAIGLCIQGQHWYQWQFGLQHHHLSLIF